jgi:hypothetical protein
VVASAPRLDERLIEQLERLAPSDATAAEIRRRLVSRARELEIPPPSYEHVRRLVAAHRLEREIELASAVLPTVVDVALGVKHGNELLRVARKRGHQPAW